MPQIKIDFYRAQLPADYNGTFQALLTDVFDRPPEERLEEVPGGWILSLRLAPARRHLTGTILRAKADEIPPAADRAGRLEDLQLARNQGIAGLTHFYYRPGNRVLLLQRNPQGVRAPAFENYLRRLGDTDVELVPILQGEVLRRLRRFRVVRKVYIRLANPQARVHFRAGRSIEALINLMDEHEALMAEVVLGMGYQRGSLNMRKTIPLLERLARLSERSREVQKVVAVGKEHEEEKTLILDLLRDKMVETGEVPVGANRRLSEEGCRRALEEAYERRKDEIEEAHGQ